VSLPAPPKNFDMVTTMCPLEIIDH
jgi:hypothetical protein